MERVEDDGGDEMTMFSELFMESRGEPVDHQGKRVHSIFERQISPGQQFRVTFLSSVADPIQGLRLNLATGQLRVNQENLTDAVLWRDTAPTSAQLTCVARKPTDLKIWNCWRDDALMGLTQAWVGNGGMLIEETERRIVLRCNSRPEITFEDLIVAIDLIN